MSKADNKELEEAIDRIEIHKDYAGLTNGTCVVNKQDLETVLKELKRLQEENMKMEIEIAEHVYWKSTPVNEIKKMYVPKDKIREKVEELEKEYKEALEENSTKAFILKCQIEILKELLEGK